MKKNPSDNNNYAQHNVTEVEPISSLGAIYDFCHLLLQEEVEDFTCTRSGDSLEVTWMNPVAPFPSSSLRLFANDSNGAPVIMSISVVLCQCNDGNCSIETSTLETAEFNQDNYYQWPCECQDFFSGDSCEVDERGCGPFSVCPDYSVCMNDTSQDSGYVCAQCREGFNISMGEKCMGKCDTISNK